MTKHMLPNLVSDVTGKYYGGAYWNEADYRITVKATSPTMFILVVEDSSGAMVLEHEFTTEEAEGLIEAVGTDQDLDSDDVKYPAFFGRTLQWTLEDDRNNVVLNENDLGEIAAWLEYALGIETWAGGDEWVF